MTENTNDPKLDLDALILAATDMDVNEAALARAIEIRVFHQTLLARIAEGLPKLVFRSPFKAIAASLVCAFLLGLVLPWPGPQAENALWLNLAVGEIVTMALPDLAAGEWQRELN
jgi:hypothetical protein